jgi:hypothetical protein
MRLSSVSAPRPRRRARLRLGLAPGTCASASSRRASWPKPRGVPRPGVRAPPSCAVSRGSHCRPHPYPLRFSRRHAPTRHAPPPPGVPALSTLACCTSRRLALSWSGGQARPPLKGRARAPTVRRAALDCAVRLPPSRHGRPMTSSPTPVAYAAA